MNGQTDNAQLTNTPFSPGRGMTNAHIQSILTSSPLRKAIVGRRSSSLRSLAQEEIIQTPEGVRLQGFRSPHLGTDADAQAAPRGLVIMLHGWEGSSDSNYLLSSASLLQRHGFEIFRLNFRDHGDSHHLNEDLFHSCRIQEVADAVQWLFMQWQHGPFGHLPVFLAGFSLGGNFALRVALKAPELNIDLRRVIAVCPPIRPTNVLTALEQGPVIYQRYFCDKWRRSLRRKQDLFPHRYSLGEWFKIKNLRDQTRYLIEHYTEFPDLQEYLNSYSVGDDALAPLSVPTTIVTAADDPVVPVTDFYSLPRSEFLEVRIETAGGHCGFLSDWSLRSWIDDYLVQRFLQEAR